MKRLSPTVTVLSLIVATYALVVVRGISLPVWVVTTLLAAGGTVVRQRLGQDRRATVLGQLLTAGVMALVVAVAVLPVTFPLRADSDQGWHLVAHGLLVPVVMVAVDLRTRSARLLAVATGALVLAVAGGLPSGPSLGGIFALWGALAVVALAMTEHDDLSELAPLRGSVHNPARERQALGARLVAVLALVAVLVMVGVALRPPTSSGGVASRRTGGSGTPPRYATFGDRLDTSARFTLGNEVVLRVRADAPDFWRGQTFDTWDGRSWTRSSAQRVGRIWGSGAVEPLPGEQVPGQSFTQVVTVVSPGSDVLVGAYRIDELHTAGGFIDQLGDGSLRANQPMGAGSVYTVVSQRPQAAPRSRWGLA